MDSTALYATLRMRGKKVNFSVFEVTYSLPLVTPAELARSATLGRDDLPPQKPVQISGFASFRRRRPPVITNQQNTNAGCESELANTIFTSVRRRKTERGANFNPSSPNNQQVS